MPESIKKTKTVDFGPYKAEVHHLIFPAEQFHGAFIAIFDTALRSGDFEADTRPLMPFVESWDAPGDPKDLQAWVDLDYIKEYLPLRRAITDVVNKIIDEQDLKN